MKRVVVYIGGQNASAAWWSYSIASPREEHRCIWLESPPVLKTVEGFTYEPIREFDEFCGIRRTWELPPGVYFNFISPSTDEFHWSEFGSVAFDIPENATAESIRFQYGQGFRTFTEEFEPSTLEIGITDMNDWTNPEGFPFDPTFDLRIYEVSQTIAVDDLVELLVESPGIQADQSIPITIRMTSLDQGHPLTFDISISKTSLMNQAAAHCCWVDVTGWGWSYSDIPGPFQSKELSAVFSNSQNLPAPIYLLRFA